jgi:hypothetical protein
LESTTSKLDSLAFRLAQDYVFQVSYNQQNKTLLEDEDVSRLIKQALNFINLSLFQSLLYEQFERTEEVFRLREKCETMFPSVIEFQEPVWAKVMWHLASNAQKRKRIAKVYIILLNNIIKIRNLFREAYHRKISLTCFNKLSKDFLINSP